MMRKGMLLAAAAAIVAAGSTVASGSAAAAEVPADFRPKAEALLRSAFPADGPGAAVIVVDDGRTVFAAGRGLADVEAGTPITPATVFRLGSITKQFAAAVMLQLVAEGKVSLDDRLSKFLPDYPKPGADATIAQLLNHTAGMQSYTGIPGWMQSDKPARAFTTDQMIAEFKDLPAPARPGEEWAYNNSGYVLVGAVIEKVTGKPWHRAVDERIARPLGLATVRYGELEPGTANMARGYTEADGKQVPARPIHMSVPHAAGALIGSVEDLARWNRALHGGRVVPPALYARMIAPTPLPGGKTHPYGFGVAPSEVRGRKSIRHGGGIFGFSTEAFYVPSEDLFVAVFTNSDDPVGNKDVLALRLAALAVGDPFPTFRKAEVDARSLEPWFGVYSVEGMERRFFAKDGRLFTRRTGGADLEVFAAGDDRFFYGDDNLAWFEMKRDTAGKPVMAMHPDGLDEAQLATYAGAVPPEPKALALPRSALARYVGSYRAAVGIATVAFGEGDMLTVQLGNGRPAPIKALSESEFAVDGADASIRFQSGGGKVTGLILTQGSREIVAERLD